jgi:hypothetical protein
LDSDSDDFPLAEEMDFQADSDVTDSDVEPEEMEEVKPVVVEEKPKPLTEKEKYKLML